MQTYAGYYIGMYTFGVSTVSVYTCTGIIFTWIGV